MQTTYKEQIEAIRKARQMFAITQSTPENIRFDLALNDAASTIAALKWEEEMKQQKPNATT